MPKSKEYIEPETGNKIHSDIPYSFRQFEADMSKMQPRFFDTYLLPAFLMYFAWRSKSGMTRWPRRILFTSGIYMFYRNYEKFKNIIPTIKKQISPLIQTAMQTEQGLSAVPGIIDVEAL